MPLKLLERVKETEIEKRRVYHIVKIYRVERTGEIVSIQKRRLSVFISQFRRCRCI